MNALQICRNNKSRKSSVLYSPYVLIDKFSLNTSIVLSFPNDYLSSALH
jgi:hypothetical protein